MTKKGSKYVFILECEMSSIHHLLSQIPQDLPFEKLLVESQILYETYPPHSIKVSKGFSVIYDLFLLLIASFPVILHY